MPLAPIEWTALTAQTMALGKNRPVVTQVEEGVWVIYAPHTGECVIGGIHTRDRAILTAQTNYSKKPIVSERVLTNRKGGSPLPSSREGDYFASEVGKLLERVAATSVPLTDHIEEDED